MKRVTKFGASLKRFLLLIYSISLFTGIFHHHHFDFGAADLISTQSSSTSQNLHIQSGTYYSCVVLQYFTNLQTAIVKNFSENLIINEEKIFQSSLTTRFYLIQFYVSGNLRRAPPVIS